MAQEQEYNKEGILYNIGNEGLTITKSVAVDDPSKPFPKKGQQVHVHYTGTLNNGTVFDTSKKRNSPFVFKIGTGAVIRGWDEGVAVMRVGEKAKLVCPPDYAYGERGHPGVIPRNATLNFEVELLNIV